MRQLTLFAEPVKQPETLALDPNSTNLLEVFRDKRVADGAHPRSVAREISQLRALAREAGRESGPTPLAVLFAEPELLAHVLRETRVPIARSTGRARLIAAQRFLRFIAPQLGRDLIQDLARLDAALPARPQAGWHTTGTVVAGVPVSRQRPAPSLDWSHLHKLVDAAGRNSSGSQASRNRALAALHCFSGLRPEEIVRLHWEQVDVAYSPADGTYRLTVLVVRRGREHRLPLVPPAADAILGLVNPHGLTAVDRSGPLFASRIGTGRALSYRAARSVLQAACRCASLPQVEAVDLRAAFAHGLRARGLSDHEVAAVLGIAKVRSIDRLLERHRALDAQRTVRELLDR